MRTVATFWVVSVHFWVIFYTPVVVPSYVGADYFDIETLHFSKYLPFSWDSIENVYFNVVNLFFNLGYQGVHIFFVISGFGLAWSHFERKNRGLTVYLYKRFIRLYPAYWILLVLLTVLYSIKKGKIDVPWRGMVLLDSGIPFTWFNFYLIQFYIMFPILMKWMIKCGVVRFLIWTFLVKSIWTFFVLLGSYIYLQEMVGIPHCPGYFAIPRMFEFCLGMAVARVAHHDQERIRNLILQNRILFIGVLSWIVGSFLTLTEARIEILSVYMPIGLSVSDSLIGFGLSVLLFRVASILLHHGRWIGRVLIWISKYTYEIYLTQIIGLLFIKLLLKKLSPDISYGMAAVISLPVFFSGINLRNINRFGIKYIHKMDVESVVVFKKPDKKSNLFIIELLREVFHHCRLLVRFL